MPIIFFLFCFIWLKKKNNPPKKQDSSCYPVKCLLLIFWQIQRNSGGFDSPDMSILFCKHTGYLCALTLYQALGIQKRSRCGPLSKAAYFWEMVALVMHQGERDTGKHRKCMKIWREATCNVILIHSVDFDKGFSLVTQIPGPHSMGLFFCCVHWQTSDRKGCVRCSCQEGKQYVAPRTELVPDFVIWVLFCVQKARSSWSWGDYRLCYMDVLLPRVWLSFLPRRWVTRLMLRDLSLPGPQMEAPIIATHRFTTIWKPFKQEMEQKHKIWPDPIPGSFFPASNANG